MIRVWLWLFNHVPLGPLAPWVLGLIVGSPPRRVQDGARDMDALRDHVRARGAFCDDSGDHGR